MGKLAAVLKLTRVEHSVMLVIAVMAAELIAGGLPAPSILLLSLISPMFISMGSFAMNDYFDVKVDRLNKKNRPLVNGTLRRIDAVYIAIFSFMIGIAASAMINAYAFVIAVVFAVLSILYSYKIKEMFFLGNAYIALTMVIPFIFGNYVVSMSIANGILLISVMVFLSGLAREIHGTIRDYRGDVKVRNLRSMPKVIGIRASATLALALYFSAILVSAYLFLEITPFRHSLIYGVIIGISDVMLLYSGIAYISKNAERRYDTTRNISLFAMGLALVAIALSAVVHI